MAESLPPLAEIRNFRACWSVNPGGLHYRASCHITSWSHQRPSQEVLGLPSEPPCHLEIPAALWFGCMSRTAAAFRRASSAHSRSALLRSRASSQERRNSLPWSWSLIDRSRSALGSVMSPIWHGPDQVARTGSVSVSARPRSTARWSFLSSHPIHHLPGSDIAGQLRQHDRVAAVPAGAWSPSGSPQCAPDGFDQPINPGRVVYSPRLVRLRGRERFCDARKRRRHGICVLGAMRVGGDHVWSMA